MVNFVQIKNPILTPNISSCDPLRLSAGALGAVGSSPIEGWYDRDKVCPERETMFSAEPGGAWSQEASISPPAVGEGTAPDAVRPTRKEALALRKKEERAHLTTMWARLELLAPTVDMHMGKPGYRSKALQGRSKEELLKDVMHAVRLAQGQRVLQQSE